MKQQETRKSETLPDATKTKSTTKALMRATLHCPICGMPAKRYATTYYCEDCNVDFDESKRLII